MKTSSLIVTLALAAASPQPSFARSSDDNPIVEFVGSYLLGKATDAVWDTATGKPDVSQLQQRITRLEQLLGDSAAPISKLKTEVTPTTTEATYNQEASTAIESLRRNISQDPQALSHIYVGSVGRLKAVFSLYWGPEGKVTGVYCNPTRDASRIYELVGTNPTEGVLNLTEYTDGVVSAKLSLSKSASPAWILWEGKMQNTDGRILNVAFQRERK